ncbi:hypothetical protein ACFOZ1_09150 [Gracilibacillus marinus]|uniref:Uncharacterized protein n=1 Tax=Gracilibacillus marinus TaxID=630535 RepID=A0ABV8VVG4_9BACI
MNRKLPKKYSILFFIAISLTILIRVYSVVTDGKNLFSIYSLDILILLIILIVNVIVFMFSKSNSEES